MSTRVGTTERYTRRYLATDRRAVARGRGTYTHVGFYGASADDWRIRIERRLPAPEPGETDPPTENRITIRTVGADGLTSVRTFPVSEDLGKALFLGAQAKVVYALHAFSAGQTEWRAYVYYLRNEPLTVLEAERPDGATDLGLPEWCGREISYEARYDEVALAFAPFHQWDSALGAD